MVDKQIWAVAIQVAGKLVSGLLSLRTPKLKSEASVIFEESSEPSSEVDRDVEQKKKGVACLPCINSHLLACRGLLDEGHRMSHDGLTPDSMERVDQCLGEIAAAERVDLAPSNIAKLPKEEQEIARYAAREMRNIRHDLEGLPDPQTLERAAAKTTELQKHVSQEYVKLRLSRMDPATRARFEEKVKEKIEKVDKELASDIR